MRPRLVEGSVRARATTGGEGASRALRFAAVGAVGVGVNLGMLHLLAGVLGLPDVPSSALAIEASILSNFVLNDAYTFRDRRQGAGPLRRLWRFQAVTAVGFVIQLGAFVAASALLERALGRSEPGDLRYLAQGIGIALGFVWNYVGSARYAWGAGAVDPVRAQAAARLAAPALFGVLLVVDALPIWMVRWFPSQDGPLHVENVLALVNAHTPLLARWYVPNWHAQPNWLTQLVLAGLLRFTTPVLGEKLILTAYAIGLPLAFRAALPRGQKGWWVALGVFPFVASFPFQMGFWNFCWGLALYFAALAVWGRRRGRLSPGRGAALAVLAVLLYFAHLVAFAAFVVTVAATVVWRGLLALRHARGHPARRRVVLRGYVRRAAAAALFTAPGTALVLAWLAAHRGDGSARIPFAELAAKLAVLYALVGVDRREVFLAAGVSLAIAVGVAHVVLARSTRLLRPHDGWLVAAIAFVVLYFAIPDVVAAGAYVSDRMALFAFLCALAWIGAGAAPAAGVRRIGVALSALALLLVGVRMEKERVLSGYVGEYVSAASVVPQGAVFLPLAFTPHGPRDADGRWLGYRTKPFLHAAGWIVAERGGIDLDNSQANTDQCPVRWRPQRNPFDSIAGSIQDMEAEPPCVDLSAASPEGGRVRWVLVWGATKASRAASCGNEIETQLARRYERVWTSAPHGLLQVWAARRETARR